MPRPGLGVRGGTAHSPKARLDLPTPAAAVELPRAELAASALVGGLHHHLRNSPPSSGTSRLPVLIPVCAENLIRIDCVTESQLIVLQRRVSGRAQLTNGDRLLLVM